MGGRRVSMREILFRGIDEGTQEWVYGYYCEKPSPFRAGKEYSIFDNKALSIYTVRPQTVGQSTGLWDKNKKMIFEGDIIKFGINARLMYVHWNEETLTWELTDVGVAACEVNHLINTFELAEIQVESAYGEMFSEIVGNIHDNPELNKKE